VGTYAVQIAKTFDATVTAVCSTRNVDMVRSIGADRVIDYTKEDFTRSTQRYDVILDNIGNHSLAAFRRVLAPRGTYVAVGASSQGPWLGPLARLLATPLMSLFVSQRMTIAMARSSAADLAALGDLLASGRITSVVDRRYELRDTADAVAYVEQGHARGK